jgi:D-sedoheptulose 7-phosphate isomerase
MLDIDDYLSAYDRHLQVVRDNKEELNAFAFQLKATNLNDGRVFFLGNGGSLAICEHAAVDFSKQGGVNALSFSSSSFLSCLSNDYSYAESQKKWLELNRIREGDTAVVISSSGESASSLNAAEYASEKKAAVITMSGFKKGNSLSRIGDLNFWVEDFSYNRVENMHQIILLTVCDMLVGKAIYSAN